MKNTPKTNPPEPNPEVEQLTNQINDLTADLQRTRADFENFHKRVEAEKQANFSYGEQSAVRKLIPLLDNFQHALNAHAELEPLRKSFDSSLSELHLEVINPAPNTLFDPELHNAIAVEGEGEKEFISEVLQPGYLLSGQPLRPALVKVTKQD